jgi:hypothetical protein
MKSISYVTLIEMISLRKSYHCRCSGKLGPAVSCGAGAEGERMVEWIAVIPACSEIIILSIDSDRGDHRYYHH